MIRASMRPRFFDRGKGFFAIHFGADVTASMRPRFFDRGKSSAGEDVRTDGEGFNEATVL